MKLYAKIQDREAGYEYVVLCQFKDEQGDECFFEEVERHNEKMIKILADEGCCHTEYYYPVKRYYIAWASIYE